MRVFDQNIAQPDFPASERVLYVKYFFGGQDFIYLYTPLDQLSELAAIRPDIRVPSSGSRQYLNFDSSVPLSQRFGIHPDMESVKRMYDLGLASVVHGVGVASSTRTHFGMKDAHMKGGATDKDYTDGVLARHFHNLHPNYPVGYPDAQYPDPFSVEFGSTMTSIFSYKDGRRYGLNINDPQGFNNSVQRARSSIPSQYQNTRAGDLLAAIAAAEQSNVTYSQRISDVHTAGSNQSSYDFNYPEGGARNRDKQVHYRDRDIAKSISGGSKVRIYLSEYSGFDHHSGIVVDGDPSRGIHPQMAWHGYESTEAFMHDMWMLGLSKKVCVLVFSEFSRSLRQNGSLGTDHGNFGAWNLFSGKLKGGIYGDYPRLLNRQAVGSDPIGIFLNSELQYDYRSVLRTVIEDFLGSPTSALAAANLSAFPKLDLFNA